MIKTLIALVLGAATWPLAAQEAAPLTLLTNARQVLDLGIEGARSAPHPVLLRAVVTYPTIRPPCFTRRTPPPASW
ncbi:MAG TPA: hypothetical protein VGO59_04090 [Verrucomicrobiae bacterium]|jgi:hypothetical protein